MNFLVLREHHVCLRVCCIHERGETIPKSQVSLEEQGAIGASPQSGHSEEPASVSLALKGKVSCGQHFGK